MVDLPLDKLLAIGMADLRRNQEAFKQTAAKIDPSKTPQQILEEATHDHPAPDHLLQSFRDVLGGLKDYIATKQIITIPSPVLPHPGGNAALHARSHHRVHGHAGAI